MKNIIDYRHGFYFMFKAILILGFVPFVKLEEQTTFLTAGGLSILAACLFFALDYFLNVRE